MERTSAAASLEGATMARQKQLAREKKTRAGAIDPSAADVAGCREDGVA